MALRQVATAVSLLVGMLVLLAPGTASATGVLLVHDAGPEAPLAEKQAIAYVRDLLGHFGGRVTVTPAEDYKAGLIADHEALFYLGFWEGDALPADLLADCAAGGKPVCWIGQDVDQLLDLPARRSREGGTARDYGFRAQERSPEAGPDNVTYRGARYWRSEEALVRVTVTDPEVCDVLAMAEGRASSEAEGPAVSTPLADEAGSGGMPYAVRSGDLWYFAELPLFAPRQSGVQLILCDQAHDVLDQAHERRRTALIYVRGVTPSTDPGKLADLARQLRKEGLAFAIEVSPLTEGPTPAQALRLTQRRALVSALRGAQREGASIIGVIGYRPDNADREPAQESAQQSARAHAEALPRAVEEALTELVKCGLYPVAWTLARELSWQGEAWRLGELFSTILERRLDSPDAAAFRNSGFDTLASLPFLVVSNEQGQQVMPDNVPPLKEGRGEVEAILDAALRQAAVPDPWVAVGIAPGAPTEAVRLLVEGLRRIEYAYADLRYMDNWTKEASLSIRTVSAQYRVDELLAEGWEATLLGPEPGVRLSFDRPGKDRRDEAVVHAGSVLVSYPAGKRPRMLLTFDGDPQQITERLVNRVARGVVVFALAATAVLLFIYLAQLVRRRGA